MFSVVKIVFLCSAFAITGCTSLNPFAGNSKNKPESLINFKPLTSLKTAWTTKIGKSDGMQLVPAVKDDVVFAASAGGAITSIDLNNGTVRWRTDAGLPLTAGVGTDGDTIAVGANNGVLLAFDRNGKLKWKAQASSEILSAPAVGQGVVVIRSIDNYIAAFDAASGARRWTVQRSAPALTLRAAPGIVIDDRTAYVALPGGRLSALSLDNGGPRWEIAVGDPRGTTELERIADVSGYPVITGEEVCAVAFQGRIGCFDAATGTPRWVKKFSSDVGLDADQQSVISVNEGGHIVSLDKNGGDDRWRNEKLGGRNPSPPGLFLGYVAVGDYQGFVHLLKRENGEFAARMPTDGSRISVKPVVAGSKLILQTQSGSIVAFLLDKV